MEHSPIRPFYQASNGGSALDHHRFGAMDCKSEEHRAPQKLFWQADRIAWIGFGIVLLLAVIASLRRIMVNGQQRRD